MSFKQVPHTILLVRPAAFGFNPETAQSNAFQKEPANKDQVQEGALKEFNEVITQLNQKGISTIIIDDTLEPLTTDAIFPNNWITTHEDGKVILYPMMAPSRRNERRKDVVELLRESYNVTEVIDLSIKEEENSFLEGTGSIIFDHPNRIAYACRSDRTDGALFESLCAQLGYQSILFDAVDENGVPIYHTNVMMWVGEKLAGVCLDAIHSEEDEEVVLKKLQETNHKVIALNHQQMNSFAGNMFEVRNENDDRFLLLSRTAFDALIPGQIDEIEKHVSLLPVDISTIEESAGGSIRCMVAGIHLPNK